MKLTRNKATNIRRAATMVMVVVLLPVLLIIAAFAINVAHFESVRAEVQVVTDAATRAAAREYLLTNDKNLALAAAQDLASRNPVNGGYVVPLTMSDLEFGVGVRANVGDPYSFTNTGSGNAVRITTNTLADGSSGIMPILPILSNQMQPRMTAVSTQGVIDVALVVDRSGSMAYAANEVTPTTFPPAPASAPSDWEFGDEVPPNARWLDLVGAVNVFINEMNNSPTDELCSLTFYNESSDLRVNLTSNYSPMLAELQAVSDNFTSGGTNIGGGMLTAKSSLNSSHGRPEASKVVILMTDGVHNIGTGPLSAANQLANNGVTLFTVTFSDEADQAIMQQAAQRADGKHYHAVDAAQLQAAFREIARSLPSLLTE